MSGRASPFVFFITLAVAIANCSQPADSDKTIDVIEIRDSQLELNNPVAISGLTAVVNPANTLSYYIFWSISSLIYFLLC